MGEQEIITTIFPVVSQKSPDNGGNRSVQDLGCLWVFWLHIYHIPATRQPRRMDGLFPRGTKVEAIKELQ